MLTPSNNASHSHANPFSNTFKEVLNRKLVFVLGKGGVGKSVVAESIAHSLSGRGKKTLLVTVEEPDAPTYQLTQVASQLWKINLEPFLAFKEFVGLKIGNRLLTEFFVNNRLIQYLAKAAPGIAGLVLLGKIWHERENFDHVVVDMPATGHGVAMFHATRNFSELFRSGRLEKDASGMIQSFATPTETGFIILAIAEEMPLQEALELGELMKTLFPENTPSFVANKLLPINPAITHELKEKNLTSSENFLMKRLSFEQSNLKIWQDAGIQYSSLFLEPDSPNANPSIVSLIEKQIEVHS